MTTPAPEDSPSPSLRVVLVTGCAGFIGSHVSAFLLRRGDVVVGVDEINEYYDVRLKRHNLDQLQRLALPSGRFHFYESDVDNAQLLSALLSRHSVTSVIHLAARAGVRPSIAEPHLYTHSNITATVTLLQCVKQHLPPIQHFVYASSSSVYGDAVQASSAPHSASAARGFVESQCTDEPVSVYAATKKACELLVGTYSHQYELLCSGLRFFTVYGPWGRPDMFPFLLLDSIERGLPVKQFGDGSSSRDFTYIDDIVDGVIAVHDRRRVEAGSARQHEVFNLGGSDSIRLSDFIRTVERVAGKRAQVQVVDNQAGDVQHTFADCSKAARMVGYEPKVSVEEGMRRCYRWYKDEYEPWRAQHPTLAATKPSTLRNRLTALQASTSMSSLDERDGARAQEQPSTPISTASTASPVSCATPSPTSSQRTIGHQLTVCPPAVDALPGLLLCTRIHCGQVSDGDAFLRSDSFLRHLQSWLHNAVQVAAHVAIAVDCTDGRTDVYDCVLDVLEQTNCADRVALVRVAPWGRFCPALNALLQHAAATSDVSDILFSSLEATRPLDEVAAMQSELRSSKALVVGARLEGHDWHRTELGCPASPSAAFAPLSGLTVPWNTAAMWSVRALSRTGFLSVSDDAVHGGVEEAAVVAMHSLLAATRAVSGTPASVATLLDFVRSADGATEGSAEWKAEWEDEGRAAWHRAKMESKARRAQWQLDEMDVDGTRSLVQHKTITL